MLDNDDDDDADGVDQLRPTKKAKLPQCVRASIDLRQLF